MAAKIDNTAIQDGYALYHHNLIFTENKKWAVIQQGMNPDNNYARRYHWLSEHLKTFIIEPHTAIIGTHKKSQVLDMTSRKSIQTQKTSLDLVNDHPNHLKREWALLTKPATQTTLDSWNSHNIKPFKTKFLHMPRTINWKKITEIYEFQPKNYEQFLAIPGVGANIVRALALISDLIYGATPSWHEPLQFTYAHGGKDGVPKPVDKPTYDTSIHILKNAITHAKIGNNERLNALKRLHHYYHPLLKKHT